MEIERKFLITEYEKNKLSLNTVLSHRLIQYYVKVGDVEERFRMHDDICFHTIKRRVDGGLQREEIETICTANDFEVNKQIRIGNIIEKTRYILPYGKYKIEIDVFSGALNGLIVGEVEFQTIDEANSFIPPDFFGAEVTMDKAYKNQSLAVNGIPT